MKKVFAMMLAGMVMVGATFAFAEDVYVTKNGKKYHKMDCQLIEKKGPKPIALEEAIQKGLKPCRKCYEDSTVSLDNNAVQPLADIDNPVVIK